MMPSSFGTVRAAALAVVVLLAALCVTSLRPPEVRPDGRTDGRTDGRPAGAAPDSFSADRAYRDVQRIGGSGSHVAGSAHNAEIAGWLRDRMTALGLRTTVRDGVGLEVGHRRRDAVIMGRARNVVALLPGTAPTGRLFLVSHYDSVELGPGANDDGAGVATLLSVADILSRGPRPRNDIVFVFTDAEEACLCGAEMFVGQDPLAVDGGVVLNVEARGSGGPVVMFETSRGNARLVARYAAAAPHPVATSFAAEVYRILPNDTDLTPFLRSGRFTGLNAAYIDGSAVYHTPLDLPATMDRRSLQHHGDNTLALARSFGRADLRELSRPGGADATYLPVAGMLVRYPAWLTWPLAVLALAGAGALAVLSRRRGLTSGRRLAAGFALSPVPLVAAPVAAVGFWAGLVALRPGYAGLADPYRPLWFRLALLSLTAVVCLSWYALSRRRVGPDALAVGALGWLAVLGVVLAAVTPGGSYLAVLPALAGSGAGLVAVWSGGLPGWARVVVTTVGAAVAVLVLVPVVVLFLPALGMAGGAAPALFATLLGLALLPCLEWLFPGRAPRRRLAAVPPPAAVPPLVAGVLAVVCAAAGLATDRFDRAHPVPTQLMYVLDADTGRARWVSAEADPVAWTRRFVTRRERVTEYPLVRDTTLWTGPARSPDPAALPAPEATVLADRTTAGVRTLRLLVRPRRPVRLVGFSASVEGGGRVTTATVDGRPVPAGKLPRRGPLGVVFHAPPVEGIEVTVTVEGTRGVRLRVLDGSDGLDGLPGYSGRPPGVGIAGTHVSDLVVAARTYRL